MNNNKILKYKKAWIVIAFISLAFFILSVVCFFKFSTLIDSQKEEPIYTLTALGTLLFAFLFLVSIVLLIIFLTLYLVKAKQISKAERKEVKQNSVLKSDSNISKDINALYQFCDKKQIPFSSLLKGNYYSAILVFYTLLILFPLSFSLLLIPLKTFMNDVIMWVFCILIIFLFGFGLIFMFLINPLLIYLNGKKNILKSNIYIYEDRIRYVNEIAKNNISNNAILSFDASVYFSTIIKAKKDKNCYYFIYLNEKKAKVCLILFYKDINNVPVDFLDKKMIEINNQK